MTGASLSTRGSDAPQRSRWLAVGVLVIVAAGSALGGAAIDRVLVRQSARILGDTTFHPLSSSLRSPSEADRQRYRRELSQALSLSTEQNRVIDSILSSRSGQFEALRQSIRPAVETLLADVRADVERVLTAEQRDRYRALQRRTGAESVAVAPR